MSRCLIVGEKDLAVLVHRYDGLGKPLTSDEREILLAALYFESEAKGGIVRTVRESAIYKQTLRGEPK